MEGIEAAREEEHFSILRVLRAETRLTVYRSCATRAQI